LMSLPWRVVSVQWLTPGGRAPVIPLGVLQKTRLRRPVPSPVESGSRGGRIADGTLKG
jgi:hypothetical protein